MANREQGKTGVKPETERKLALDKEELKDLEPQEEDQEHVRGGSVCNCQPPLLSLACGVRAGVGDKAP